MEVDLKNGYGFVEFEDNRDADDAVYELNGKELCGERVIVEHARGPRRDRDGYGGGGGGGGYWGGGRSKCSVQVFSPFPGQYGLRTAGSCYEPTHFYNCNLDTVIYTQQLSVRAEYLFYVVLSTMTFKGLCLQICTLAIQFFTTCDSRNVILRPWDGYHWKYAGFSILVVFVVFYNCR